MEMKKLMNLAFGKEKVETTNNSKIHEFTVEHDNMFGSKGKFNIKFYTNSTSKKCSKLLPVMDYSYQLAARKLNKKNKLSGYGIAEITYPNGCLHILPLLIFDDMRDTLAWSQYTFARVTDDRPEIDDTLTKKFGDNFISKFGHDAGKRALRIAISQMDYLILLPNILDESERPGLFRRTPEPNLFEE